MPTNIYQRTAMAAAIATCFPAAGLAAPVARVDFAAGSVSAVSPSGQTRALNKGSEIEVGETVQTQQGRAQLRFVDGAYMSLQPQTEFKVEEFKYSGKAEDQSNNIVMNLLKGGLRTITGLIGRSNRNAYRLKTDVATIGIRGTEYTVKYTNSIEVYVNDGAVSVENQSGSFTVPGGTGVLISNDQTPPQQTDQKPVLPPETPVEQQEKQITEQLPPPPNPIQDSQPPAPLLTGTHTGNWVATHPSIFPYQQDGRTIVLDANGALESVDGFEGSFTLARGSSQGISDGNDGVIAWGRWANGTLGGDSPFSGTTTVPPSELHYVVGISGTIPTTGTATYTVLGATPPSYNPSSFEGGVVFNSSTLKIDFGTTIGEFHAKFTVNGSTVETLPNGVGFCLSGSTFNSGSSMSGPFSSFINFSGILAGENAARAGVSYVLNTTLGGVHGAIAYTKSGP